jgi:hypothetical protein
LADASWNTYEKLIGEGMVRAVNGSNLIMFAWLRGKRQVSCPYITQHPGHRRPFSSRHSCRTSVKFLHHTHLRQANAARPEAKPGRTRTRRRPRTRIHTGPVLPASSTASTPSCSSPCWPSCFLVSGQFRCISKCMRVLKYGKVPRAIGFFNLLLC